MYAEDSRPSHAETFRHSVPIRVAAYWVLWLGTAVCTRLGLHPLPTRSVLLVTLVETTVLAACRRRAAASRAVAGAYLAFEAACQTAVFWLCGDVRLGLAPIVYTFELINPGIQLRPLGCFAVANGFSALFVTLVLAQHAGLVPRSGVVAPAFLPGLDALSVLIVFTSLNLAAVFVSESTRLVEAKTVELAQARATLRAHSTELEERVRQRTTELEESYRALQEKGEELRAFVYTVTHDLKNPVSSIVLRADMILEREGAALSPAARADVRRISRSAEHTEDMIRDLLQLFRITSTPEAPSWVSLHALAQRSLSVLGPRIQVKRVQVEVGALPIVWGQARKLSHVLTNLLDNAVKYVPEGAGRVRVDAAEADGHVTLCVRDNGIGIAAPYQGRIFETFGRVPEAEQRVNGAAVGGSGVGLAAVKHIVEAHGGKVWVESEPGIGSAFFAELPRELRA